MSKELQLAFLGSLDIHRAGVPVTDIKSSKAQALLCYLAVTGRPHRRSSLAGLLWGDLPESKARTNLRKALTTLRRSVGPHLNITRETVAFNRKLPYWLDVELFEATVSRTSDTGFEQLRAAVELYQGDFLEGFCVRGALAFEEWVLAQQARLRELALQALHTLALHYTQQGDAELPTGIDYITRLLALEPWREEAHRQLMTLLAQSGQRGAALAQYETCHQILAQELDVEPGPETTALYERIRDGERCHLVPLAADAMISPGTPFGTPVFRHSLPPQSTPFIGRKKDVADIVRRLQDPTCRLLTLVGPGGIGKTRLALHAAQDLVGTGSAAGIFGHGVFFVSLTPINSLGGLISAIAETVNFNFHSDASPRQQLLDYLREKAMLLVLDNFEHLLAHVGLIAEILAAAPAVRILVTSREALNLQEAWFHPVGGMSFPCDGPVEDKVLAEYDAVQLFVQSARRACVGFSLAASEQSVARICQLVEGMPLAIELAAAWLNLLSCDQIVGEIERNLDFLTVRHANVPERHRSMRAVFEHSWQLLAEEERDVLKKLSVFQGGFRLRAAEYVAGASLMILRSLTEKSLLRPSDIGRYQMHELLRQFAGDKLRADSTEMTITRDRHSTYYLAFLQAREASLQGAQQRTALMEINKDIGNVRSGWNWAVEQGRIDAVDQAVQSLFDYFQIRGQYQEGEEAFGCAATHLRQLDVPVDRRQFNIVWAKTRARQGVFNGFLGLTEPAKDHLQTSLTVAQESGHQGEIAFCLSYLGQFTGWQGHYAKARRLTQKSLAISKAIDDQRSVAIALRNLAEVAQFLGENAKAKRLALESLDISRKLGRRDWIAYALDRLGFNTFALGEYAESERYYRESLTIFKEIGDQLGASLAFGGLGWIAWAAGGTKLGEAETLGQQSLAIARDCGHRFHIATRLGILGQIANGVGQPEQAQLYYQEGLAISRSLDAAVPMTKCLSGLGDVSRQSGDLQASRDYLTAALKTGINARLLAYTLEALVYYAALLAQESDAPAVSRPARQQMQLQALELATLVCQHSSCWKVFRDRAAELQARLGEQLPAEITAAAPDHGRSRPLADVVTRITALDAHRALLSADQTRVV